MLDFKELPVDGQAFEQLVREVAFGLGLHVQWSGRGPDGGRDLICRETLTGVFGVEQRTWLVQCKHNAHADRSVGVADLDDIIDSCVQHGATGYVLACSTQPSSGVVSRLEGITTNPTNQITATYWDAIHIERLLSNPRMWALAQHFLPLSAGAWKIFATERPNEFVAHYKGYIIHLSNRIGSRSDGHLDSVAARVTDIEAIELPKGHMIRPRAVWYDDKNGGYTWYIDYMYPAQEKPVIRKSDIKDTLGDGWALEDGQCYSFDVSKVQYHPFSDHHDEDHYDYYLRYAPNFLSGSPRGQTEWDEYYATKQEVEELVNKQREIKEPSFQNMLEKINALPFVNVLNAWNAQPEELHRFARRRIWTDIMADLDWKRGNFFDAHLRLSVSEEQSFHDFIRTIPQDIGSHFDLARAFIYMPGGELIDDGAVYNLDLSVSLVGSDNELKARRCLNEYFDQIAEAADNFLGR